MLGAAWTLSRLSPNLLISTIVTLIMLLTLVTGWTLLYLRVPLVRDAADDYVARIHSSLPEGWQDTGARVWHTLLPYWMISRVAPSCFVVTVLLVVAFLPRLLLNFGKITHWCLNAAVFRAPRRQGTVYGATVEEAAAMSARDWAEYRQATATRPDLSKGISNSAWITVDEQERFFANAQCNAKLARQRLDASSKWRSKMGIDTILKAKQPHWLTMKQAFPHGILCRSKSGHVVFFMRLSVLIDRYHIIEDAALTTDDLVKHLAFVYEYMFRKCDPRDLPYGRLINLIDMEGLNVMDMRGKAAKLGNLSSAISANHYPDRLHKALMINCPGMINQMWNVAKGMVDKNAQDRTKLYTKKDTLAGLREELADEDIPREWGGSREAAIYNHELELGAWQLVSQNNGVSLQELRIEGEFEPPEAKTR